MSTQKIPYKILNAEFDLESLTLINNPEINKVIKELSQSDLTTYLNLANILQKLGFDTNKILDLISLELDQNDVQPLTLDYYHVDNYYYSTIALYVNNGDTYQETILFSTEDRTFIISSWGDFYESFSQNNPDPYLEEEEEDLDMDENQVCFDCKEIIPIDEIEVVEGGESYCKTCIKTIEP